MVNERINTCLSLFNSCNDIETFIKETLTVLKEVDSLSEEDVSKLLNYQRNGKLDDNQEYLIDLSNRIQSIERPSSDSFQKMVISLSALFISLYKEKIIEKDSNKDLSLKVNNATYGNILSNITIFKNNKYYLGDIEFDDQLQCLDFLRNKLLHGDYHIIDNKIYMKKDNKVGEMSFFKLINFCFILSNLSKCNGKVLEDSIVLFTHVRWDSSTLKDFLRSNLFKVDFKVTMKGKRTINMDIINLINDIQDLAMHYNLTRPMFLADTVHLAIQEKEKEIAECKCRVDFEITPYILFNGADDVIKRFLSEYRSIKDKDSIKLDDVLNYVNSNSFVNNTEVLNESYSHLTNFLLRFMPNWCDNTVKHDVKDDNINEMYSINLSFNLLKFYCYFNYGLDQIFSDGITTNLRDILEGRKFDYSQLDLSLFDDPNMTVEHTITSYQAQVSGINNEYNRTLAAYQKALNSYNGFISRFGNTNPSVESKLNNNCVLLNNQLQNITALQNKSNNFDFNKYVRNLNIINHLRNSIAHGNYEIDDSDPNNIYYNFNDIYNGVTTYSLSIKVKDFESIFGDKQLIQNYLDDLAVNYLGKSKERLRYEELLLNCSYINSSKLDEWNQMVIDALDNNDDSMINKLYLVYLSMKEVYSPSIYVKSLDKFTNASGSAFSKVLCYSLMKYDGDIKAKYYDRNISLTDYNNVVELFLNYFKEMNFYEAFIKEHVLPLCEEGSFLKEYYDKKKVLK